MNILERLISSKEASELLNLNEQYVKQLCASGKLPCKKVGKTWVLDKENLKRV